MQSSSLFTLPSSTVLVGVLKSRFNTRQTLPAQEHPILQIIVSTPIQDFLCVITDITVFSSDSHWVEPNIIARIMIKPKMTAPPTIIAQMPLSMSLGQRTIKPTNKQNSKKPISVQNPPNDSEHNQNRNDCTGPAATTLLFYLFSKTTPWITTAS